MRFSIRLLSAFQRRYKYPYLVTYFYNLPLVESFDVEYYRDLEIWVIGHSRSLKLVPFKSSGAVSYIRLLW